VAVVQLQSSPATSKLSSSCGFIVTFVDRNFDIFFYGLQGKAVSNSELAPLADFRSFGRKTTFPEPWKVAAHVIYPLKTKPLNSLGANVRDGFFNRIRRVNQV